jgi:putative ABC transport system ATP-binding protein
MELLLRLNGQGTTVVMVTHSSECAGFASRRLLVTDGRLTADDGRRSSAAAVTPDDPLLSLVASA